MNELLAHCHNASLTWVALQGNYELAQAVKALTKSGRKFKRVVKQVAKVPVNAKSMAHAA